MCYLLPQMIKPMGWWCWQFTVWEGRLIPHMAELLSCCCIANNVLQLNCNGCLLVLLVGYRSLLRNELIGSWLPSVVQFYNALYNFKMHFVILRYMFSSAQYPWAILRT